MLDALKGQLCLKLCRHNIRTPTVSMCTLIFPTDHQTAGRQVCAWPSGALLSAARKVDWTAGEASRVGAQSGTTGGKGTLQLLSDLTSYIPFTTRLALPTDFTDAGVSLELLL